MLDNEIICSNGTFARNFTEKNIFAKNNVMRLRLLSVIITLTAWMSQTHAASNDSNETNNKKKQYEKTRKVHNSTIGGNSV